jgi:hypothetical protein
MTSHVVIKECGVYVEPGGSLPPSKDPAICRCRKPYDNSVTLVRERTIPTERPQLVGEVSANFCG